MSVAVGAFIIGVGKVSKARGVGVCLFGLTRPSLPLSARSLRVQEARADSVGVDGSMGQWIPADSLLGL